MGVENFHTPCFVLDEDEFKSNILIFQDKLNNYFEKSILGYSFKTNSLPYLLKIVKECGGFAEVVSDDEYRLAETVGFQLDKIIFNGPIKSKEMFEYAITNGSLVNIDSKRECDWLIEIGKIQPIDVGIRVNFDLESSLPGQTTTGKKGGRFGFCYENGELKKTIDRLLDNNICITRLHMHVSNSSKSVDVYRALAQKACEIIDNYDLKVSAIDFGGGYFGGGDSGKAYEDYISAIYDVLEHANKEKLCVIVEPGASVVATAFSYITEVVDKKSTTYGDFIVTDGTRLHIDPFMTREKYCYNTYPNKKGVPHKQVICGYTCMENDRIMCIDDRELEIGDRIEYKIVGSYTMSFNSLFITYFPDVYSKSLTTGIKLVREKWNTNELLQKCRW